LSEPEVNITENEVAKGGSGGMEANGPCLLVKNMSMYHNVSTGFISETSVRILHIIYVADIFFLVLLLGEDDPNLTVICFKRVEATT